MNKFPTPRGFRTKLFMKRLLITTYFFHLPATSGHHHPLQVENCESNSQLVVDEDDNGKFRLEGVKSVRFWIFFI